jgi:hypothetical protein
MSQLFEEMELFIMQKFLVRDLAKNSELYFSQAEEDQLVVGFYAFVNSVLAYFLRNFY